MATRKDKSRRPPVVGDDEIALWRQITKDAKPLKRKPLAPAAEPDVKPAVKSAKAKAPARPRPAAAPARPAPPRPSAPLESGRAPDLDRRSLDRLRRGKLPIEGRLDLHGATQAEAVRQLDAFLGRAQAAGQRCVLVITGKGTIGRETGVLRANLPRWLNEAPLRARVLAFAQAQPAHGGAGAVYILLKRRREA